MSGLVDILNKEQLKKLLQSDLPVLADFWAPWCKPCLAMIPTLSVAANSYAGRVLFIKINIDQLTSVASDYKIKSIPHCILFYKGESLGTLIGLQPPRALADFLDHHLQSL